MVLVVLGAQGDQVAQRVPWHCYLGFQVFQEFQVALVVLEALGPPVHQEAPSYL